MEAKLNAAASALEQGIGGVHIVPGAEESIVQRVLAGECVGTRITDAATKL
jgi:acetylglutamate kinase